MTNNDLVDLSFATVRKEVASDLLGLNPNTWPKYRRGNYFDLASIVRASARRSHTRAATCIG
jgi:hypothetical protein